MKPAYSLILFTTASGAGYGLLAMMGFFAFGELAPQNRWFGLVGFSLAFGGIIVGVLASTFHLGRPDRAWRAFSQWRSSWLSREAVFAAAAGVAGVLFAFGWVVLENYTGPWRLFGMIAAMFSIITIYCTGMIHASLRPVIAWSNRHTTRVFILLGAWSGALWFNLLAHLFGVSHPIIAMVVTISGFVAFYLKRRYWRFLDTTHSPATPETATGLDRLGDVRLLDAPNTQDSYVQTEMMFVIARRHVQKLRRWTFWGAFAIPLALAVSTMESPSWVGVPAALAAVVSVTIGVWIERWLFFAEARHTVSLYYGATEA